MANLINGTTTTHCDPKDDAQQPVFDKELKKAVRKQVKKQLKRQAERVSCAGDEYHKQEHPDASDAPSRKRTFFDKLGDVFLKALPKVLIAVATVAAKAICGYLFGQKKATV